jgi:hypothetical protein
VQRRTALQLVALGDLEPRARDAAVAPRSTRTFRQPASLKSKLPTTSVAVVTTCDDWALGCDGNGRLFAWDLSTSRCEVVATPTGRRKRRLTAAERGGAERCIVALGSIDHHGESGLSVAASVGLNDRAVVRLHILRRVVPPSEE